MQYTESSFADILVGLFRGLLLPRRRSPRVDGAFPAPASFESETPDVILDRGVTPLVGRASRLLMRLRMLQQGQVQTYILYVFLGLIVLLIFG